MARLPRAEVPGWPQLVQQRSHDGVPWIRDEVDGLRALADLKEVSAAAGVQVHAYAIVAEQMLLLVTPDAPAGVSRMMQAFGRRYVGAFNRRHARAGTLWAGRYRSAMLDPAHFLLDAMVMVDALGVGRAGGVDRAAHHLHIVADQRGQQAGAQGCQNSAARWMGVGHRGLLAGLLEFDGLGADIGTHAEGRVGELRWAQRAARIAAEAV